jgi:heme-degrading monooxygenase HmoA
MVIVGLPQLPAGAGWTGKPPLRPEPHTLQPEHEEGRRYSVRTKAPTACNREESPMYTRLITWTNSTDIDGGIQYVKESALPVIHQQKGFRGLSVSANKSTGRMHILSLWDTEADRDASESALSKARDEGTEIIGGSMKVERFEEVVLDVVNPPKPGCALVVTPFSMEPGKVDENLAFFKNEVAPRIKATPGFCALRNMVDRSTGQGYVGTIWTDQAAVEAQAEAAAGSRQEASTNRGITFGDLATLDIVLVDMP